MNNDTPRVNARAFDICNMDGSEIPNPEGLSVDAELARDMEREIVMMRKQVAYVHGLISDWWKPQTTSQEMHRDYALEALGSLLPNVKSEPHGELAQGVRKHEL